MLRAFISKIWKVVNWPFLRTLPVTVLPLFTAITAGILLSLWNHALVDTNTDKWLYGIKNALGDWGVEGDVPTFRQFQDEHNDFHTMRINSNDFLAKLGFMLPEQYTDATGIPLDDLPIDMYADIENLVRDISPPTAGCGKAEKAREQWVYLTNYGFRFRDDDTIRRVRGYQVWG